RSDERSRFLRPTSSFRAAHPWDRVRFCVLSKVIPSGRLARSSWCYYHATSPLQCLVRGRRPIIERLVESVVVPARLGAPQWLHPLHADLRRLGECFRMCIASEMKSFNGSALGSVSCPGPSSSVCTYGGTSSSTSTDVCRS